MLGKQAILAHRYIYVCVLKKKSCLTADYIRLFSSTLNFSLKKKLVEITRGMSYPMFDTLKD